MSIQKLNQAYVIRPDKSFTQTEPNQNGANQFVIAYPAKIPYNLRQERDQLFDHGPSARLLATELQTLHFQLDSKQITLNQHFSAAEQIRALAKAKVNGIKMSVTDRIKISTDLTMQCLTSLAPKQTSMTTDATLENARNILSKLREHKDEAVRNLANAAFNLDSERTLDVIQSLEHQSLCADLLDTLASNFRDKNIGEEEYRLLAFNVLVQLNDEVGVEANLKNPRPV